MEITGKGCNFMDEFELIVPTIFGAEAFVVRELKRLGYDNIKVEDGRVTFWGDEKAVCRANVF